MEENKRYEDKIPMVNYCSKDIFAENNLPCDDIMIPKFEDKKTVDITAQGEYWKTMFSDEVPVLNMPLDYRRPSIQSFRGRAVAAGIQGKLAADIEKIQRKTETTDYMIFMSALMILLSKYTGQQDIVIGSPMSGRTHKDTQNIPGMFVNTLAFRGKPEKTKRYSEFLSEVKEICLNAYENQDYPFEKLIELVSANRESSRNPLFDIMFVLQNYDHGTASFDTMEMQELDKCEWHRAARFDLAVIVTKQRDGYKIVLEYCEDLYAEETAELLKNHYINLVKEIASNCEQLIGKIDVLDENEKKSILYDFNKTELDFPKDKVMAELFEEMVESSPDNLAVIFGEEKVTYGELNRRANCLADRLRHMGIGKNDFVAIMTERSVEMIAGILGIIKSGAAYVPVDPGYPKDRIEYMISDSSPKAILVYNTNIETELPVIDLKDNTIWEGDRQNLEILSRPEDVAYVIYTSGTTGRPKGVMVENHGIANLKSYFESSFKITPKDNVLQFANISFDASVWEMSMGLLTGATLIVVPSECIMDTLLFEKYCSDNNVTVATLPPQYYLTLNNFAPRLLITAGSESSKKIIEKVGTDIRYINAYGPTETTVCATHWEYVKSEAVRDSIPIGKPIPNTKVYILNGTELCGIGMPGELCIAGAGITRGYLNRLELTHERFIDNPYGEGKIYRSGDLARWLPDGNIEYLGRIDEQVKIRGYRIELGEIENVIRKIDYITDAAVIAREDSKGEKAIFAYMVSTGEIDSEEIRNIIAKSLPDYMIPAYLMQLDNIPLNRNGKVDKKALLAIKASIDGYKAPRNKLEHVICEAFCEVLKLDKVGIFDSFFELGGHSLRATMLVNLIEEKAGVRLSHKDIFLYRTPEKIANAVNQSATNEYNPISAVAVKEYYTMSPAQQRLYMVAQIDETGIAYNLPCVYEIKGRLERERFENAVKKLVARHEILRTSFTMVNGEPVQTVSKDVYISLEFVDAEKEEIDEILKGFVKPFDLGRAPLMRATVINTGEGSSLLLLDMHHIIADGISMNILLSELSSLYGNGTLPELRVQFKDYSEWLKTVDITAQGEYWKTMFSDEVPVLNMPLDYRRPSVQSFRGRAVATCIQGELATDIEKIQRKTETTDYMIFMSALMILLSKYTGQQDIVIGSPMSGRTHKDTQNIPGMFVNTLAFRGKPEKTKRYSEFLSEVKEICLNAYENQDYPFEKLIELVSANRESSRNPLFDIMFVLQNYDHGTASFDTMEMQELDKCEWHRAARFDLAVIVTKQRDGYKIVLEYCEDLYAEETAELLKNHYINLVKEIASNCEQLIGRIDVLDENEKKSILYDFNKTELDFPKEKVMAELFEEMVESSSDNLAVIFGEEKVTYGELNRRANCLAGRLRHMGIGKNDFVAIMTERSVEMIAGILGIIKSGAAYVPVDPGYPKDRIEYMISDSSPKAILVYNTNIETELPVIDLKDNTIWEGDRQNLEILSRPEDVAYVIYTSGTTGRPKGVMVENHGIANLKSYFESSFKITPKDNVLQFANISFDASVWEMSMGLLTGATLIVVPSECIMDTLLFEKYCSDNNVTVATLPPQYYLTLNNFAPRLLITAGSESSKKIIEKVGTDIRYINAYGPTETTVCATHWEYKKCEAVRDSIPIGKPIPNTKVYILNGTELCGIGMPGELCIAGAGIARGYLNRLELTHERFIDNPYGEGKIYRSGDLARWLPDRNIEYLGRIDEQVKIRGYRIELGEIDSVLKSLDKIKDAVTIIREQNNEKLLCSYIVSDLKQNTDRIREQIKNILPSFIMQVESIALNRNGKVNKGLLPEIQSVRGEDYTPPQNEDEKVLCQTFEEILSLEKVSVNVDFFELGGDSIKAIRIISKLKDLGYKVSVKDIMLGRSIRNISKYIKKDAGVILQDDTELAGEVKLTPIQKSFYRWELSNLNHLNQSVMVKTQHFDREAIKAVLGEIAIHHDMLRAVFCNSRQYVLRVEESSLYELEEYDVSHIPYEKLQVYINEKCNIIQGSFNLEKGPLIKAVLFSNKEEEHLMLCIHHLVVDGVSWRIILEDLNNGYKQYISGQKIKFPPKSTSYKSWSEKLEQYSQSQEILSQLEYWNNVKNQVQEFSLGERFLPSEGIQERDLIKEELCIDQEFTYKLTRSAWKKYNTEINDLLLTALGGTLYKATHSESIAITLESHGRHEIDSSMQIERTVGWFTNIYPVVLVMSGDLKKDIISVKETLRKVPGNGIGFGLLKEMEGVKTEVSFNYLGEINESDSLSGMEIKSSEFTTGEDRGRHNYFDNSLLIDGQIVNGKLVFEILYDCSKYSNEFIAGIKKEFKGTLEEIILHCTENDEVIKTVSDVGAESLEDFELDELSKLMDLL
ncbi:non-ribosomal peptide synthetase [Clostridium sp. BNL1100]|uniref:non-ribosomal peptide synthetase n=1 Tax=Clostridium sp. BNL1100 TaxID=755731 RepID=UPI00024A769A|nr:non-ribosomal peptide synthetase [Clostridium sp. BNL1100]AEY64767.1 non-ribosomal peptide synthase/amino acid adenylation enzyme [Clostridium sp. BNL1100]